MPAGVQPANRKLLDDVTAGAQVTQPATPLGAALVATYVPLTQKGAPSGVASLGVDGKVPAAQLPASAAPRYKAAELTVGTTLVTDPDLLFTALAVGRYVLDGVLLVQATGSGIVLTGTTTFSAGLVLGANSRLGLSVPTAMRAAQVAATGATFSAGAGFGGDAITHAATATAVPARLSGYLDVTTAGTLQIGWTATSGNVWIQPGSWVSTLKVA